MKDGFGDGNGLGARSETDFSRQRTLRQRIACTGTGLHSGAKVQLTLNPAPANHGIVFRRTDRPAAAADVPARWDHVVDTRMCSTLANAAGTAVGTVEHLMAALAGFAVDNCLLELDGPEVPIMDGSAEPFAFLIECAGLAEQDAPRRAIEILKAVRSGDDRHHASLAPASGTALSFEIDFENAVVARQRLSLDLRDGTFREELAAARTFGFAHEVEQLRRMGLARGGSLDNAVVIGEDRILNREGLRFPDEFVRHKMLDALGDLYLAGGPLVGRFHGHRAGHALNNQLLRALFADKANWRWTTIGDAVERVGMRERRSLAEVLRAS
ncbi:MAG: UDP-3-O-acyl-N-acetylglucosamine deacetylase [Rhodospirillaceae bacterium]|nr:UDP-3-O-acyl-N-acetylglucosamine deacetylase [Rhodospirillaceae bacterium]